jgi:hypothetical protein
VVLTLGANDKDWESLLVCGRSDTADAVATATCEFFLRLFATSEQHEVYIRGTLSAVPPSISGAGLSLYQRDPKLSSNSNIDSNGLERRPLSCTRHYVTT